MMSSQPIVKARTIGPTRSVCCENIAVLRQNNSFYLLTRKKTERKIPVAMVRESKKTFSGKHFGLLMDFAFQLT